LIRLWFRTLNETALFDEAKNVLTGWARLAERDDAQLDMFRRLLRMVAAAGLPDLRTRNMIAQLAYDWVDEDNLQPLPRAHATVMAALP
jgi:hypothetical protein